MTQTTSRRSSGISNDDVADAFEQVADLLKVQEANPFRVRAYAVGAANIRTLDRPLWEILQKGGSPALEAIPGIGESLAASIERYLRTGRFPLLDRLEGEVCPEALFMTVPGVGHVMAQDIHEHLGIETLEELEMAAHDGRLEGVPGFGPRRSRGVREALGTMLGRASRRRTAAARQAKATGAGGGEVPQPGYAEPLSVPELLAIDREYRDLAEQDALVRITPRRFNPDRERWLPLLHTRVRAWDVTALFSNAALAHRLGRTREWVVIYADLDGTTEQYTVVTDRKGALAGHRVVRGREAECDLYYRERITGELPEPTEDESLFLPGFDTPEIL